MIRMFSLAWFEKLVRPSVNVSALNVDWKLGDCFYKTLASSSTFTFSNIQDGKSITFMVDNISSSTVIVAFPSGIYKDAAFDLNVETGKVNTYTFARIGGKTIASFVSKKGV